jgi:exodeoxyribonuclease-5
MKFADQQNDALNLVNSWILHGDKQVFRFFGFAGTGKTTLAKHLAEGIDGEVIFAAYTGKAAHVLRSKGCENACTIHSLIYHSRDKSRVRLVQLELELENLIKELSAANLKADFIDDHPKVRRLRSDVKAESDNSEQPFFVLNTESEIRQASLIIIDECSMVDERMGKDLLSFGVPVLVLGDPAQLPPVGGAGFFTENVKPDVMLTDIHRQAGESPIIRMATETRNQIALTIGDYGDNCVVYPEGTKLEPETMLSFDQILVGKNTTRRLTNNKLRQLKGIEDKYPVIGDRLVCLRNNSELGLLNGAIFEVSDVTVVLDQKVFMSMHPEDSMASIEISAHEHHFLGTEEKLAWYEKREAQEFAYGYGLTCHKSQGSQWRSVCVFDESNCFRKDKWRWLYTAITRAADDVAVVRMKR